MDADLKTPNPLDALRLRIFLLRLYGLWPPEEEIPTWRTKLYMIWRNFMLGCVFSIYVTTEIINMYMVWGDINLMTESCFLLLTHIAQSIKILGYLVNYKRIQALTNSLTSEIFTPTNQIENEYIQTAMNRCTFDLWLFGSLAISCCSLWVLFPLLDDSGAERSLPLRTWFPFDTSPTPIFELIYTYQMFTVTLAGLVHVCQDTIVCAFMTFSCSQFEILKENLRQIWTQSIQEVQNSCNEGKRTYVRARQGGVKWSTDAGPLICAVIGSDVDESQLEVKLNERFLACVKHHKAIVSFLREVEELFNVGILAQFTISVVIICITAFELTKMPVMTLQFVSMVLYMSCMLYELGLYCWHGNQVMFSSMSLPGAIYETEWYNCNTKLKKDIRYFIFHTQKPIVLRAGNFFGLTLTTFTSILNSSYSYFTVLQQSKKG